MYYCLTAALHVLPHHDVHPSFDPGKPAQVDTIRHEPMPAALLDKPEEVQEFLRSRCRREVSAQVLTYVF
ncbi:hypothetical protein EVG20_g10667 [Dentipellis fragilis]|uniref:Uncharacterized protein n=1 Tax=Dentipellis fragilis TaxID=205917 RepID=A0A4Y9XQY7_9AGAM|nr:hypothetical protein EVG20_g10667 [Dentipellis fragilis]